MLSGIYDWRIVSQRRHASRLIIAILAFQMNVSTCTGSVSKIAGSRISGSVNCADHHEYQGKDADLKHLNLHEKGDSQKQFHIWVRKPTASMPLKFYDAIAMLIPKDYRLLCAEPGRRSCHVWRPRSRPASGLRRIALSMVFVAMRN